MVIDDDPYRLLRFAGDPLPTLRELGGGDPLVFAVRTFSKIVAPGLRVGWVDTAPELRQLIINAKQAMDTCTNLPAQRLLTGFLTGGHLENHLVVQRAEYRRRKEAMLPGTAAALRRNRPLDRSRRRFLPLGHAGEWRQHRRPVRGSTGRECRLHPRAGLLPPPLADATMLCDCVSLPPSPTGSTKESRGCGVPSTSWRPESPLGSSVPVSCI
jgi:hypothetical protein